jgi:phosphatidylinositol alpha-mannosyltransferase
VPPTAIDSIARMRIALVSPYSWTFPGGVTRHIDALAREFLAEGHHVKVFSPVDPDDRLTRVLHRQPPESAALPDYVVPLGRTFSLPMNGAKSRLAYNGDSVIRLRRELRTGDFDVIHVHEPIAPVVGWDACTFDAGTPVVGTFHAYAASWLPNTIARAIGARRVLNRLTARIAVSEAARWTGERYFGGTYDVIPNGVHTSPAACTPKPAADSLRVVFVGREEERKGLPVLLSAFAGLRQHIPVQLQIIGADADGVEPLLAQVEGGMDGIQVLGRVDDAELWRQLHDADVLCAPSLGGESFGMVLTEAFAAGTPVIASDIAGYRQVVTHGRDGLLTTPGDPLELAEVLRSVWLDPVRRAQMSLAARQRAEDFAWPQVARRVASVYERAVEAPAPVGAVQTARVRAGLVQRDLTRSPRARRLPSIEPAPPKAPRGSRALAGLRRGALGLSAIVGVLLAFLALRRVGFDNVATTLLRSSPIWVLIALGLFSTSMILRAVSWFHIVRAALPDHPVKRRTILSATSIGVLMSATLPARLGEPSRALIVARRIGRMRESLPVVAGTLVSQTLLNLLALFLLAVVVVGSNDILRGHEGVLVLVSLLPVGLALAVLVLPSLMEAGRRFGFGGGQGAIARLMRESAAALVRLRKGLQVFRRPRRAALAISAQLAAWGLQLLGAFALLMAMNLDHRAGIGAAAAVLFAVNVTAVLPATPSNVGVFQLAVITVLTGAYGVPAASALGYGLILQAVEVVTAVLFGLPALIREGVSWRDVRMRALAATPVELSPRGAPLPDTR